MLRMEAEIIHACATRGLDPRTADEMLLWEVSAYLGLHRIETRAEYDAREVIAVKQEEWDQTFEARMAKMAGYSERRRARDLERRRERSGKRGAN